MRKSIAMALAMMMSASLLAGCSSSPATQTTAAPTTTAQATTAAPETTAKATEAATTAAETTTAETTAAPAAGDDTLVRVGSLKGPTTMGLVSLMSLSDKDETANAYDFTMVTAADELLTKVISKEVDIALVPANTASVLYNKTEGQISVIDINTLGVLYIVSADDSLKTIADLKGKTIYMTGKGIPPEYTIRYLLSANGLSDSDVTLEFKSEPTEVAAILSQQPDAIGLLPQPFVTVATSQNEALKIVMDLTAEWEAVSDGSSLVTGVTIVRNEFLEAHPEAVKTFMAEHKTSSEFANANLAETAELVAAAEIIAKAPLAQKAIPYCNITYIDGDDMKTALSGYLAVLADQDMKSVGGKLPEDKFYYIP